MTVYINGVAQVDGNGATKEFFVPTFWGTDPSSNGPRINAPAEHAAMTMLVPQDFTTLEEIEVIFIPTQTGASMYVEIRTRYSAYNGGEPQDVHSETDAARNIGATVANTNLAHSISDLVDVAALVAGDLLQVYVSYDATALHTDAYVRGLRFKYN